MKGKDDYTKQLSAIDSETTASWFWMASDGIPFVIISGSDDNGNYIMFKCPMKHGLLTGEFVELPFNYNGETIFQVNGLGDDGFGSEEYIFKIYVYLLVIFKLLEFKYCLYIFNI
jgi:hypothetical protein